jgi:hypothetical protein
MANLANIKAWHDALLSGKYRQGKGALARCTNGEVEYCCLGVVCELAGLRKEQAWWSSAYFSYPKYGATDLLPLEAQQWLGIDVSDPLLDSSYASFHNDHGDTFAEIAALIRAKWPEAFAEEAK